MTPTVAPSSIRAARRLAPLLLLVLAACATPQQRCINTATRDLRTVDRLAAESQRNLDRGYAVVQDTVFRDEWVPCGYRSVVLPDGRVRRGAPYMCWDERAQTISRPVAIDLKAEASKLESLKKKRAELVKGATAATAQCKELHPE